jgi:hypothetical protein
VRLVLAHHAGHPCRTVRNLDAEEVTALARHFREGVNAPGLVAWFDTVSRLRLWIACDCRGEYAQAPLLFVRVRDSTTYALARMPDRPPHVASCAFAGKPALVTGQDVAPPLPGLMHLLVRWFAAARLNVLFPYEGEGADALSAQYGALRDISRSLAIASGGCLYDVSRTHPQGLAELVRRLQHLSASSRAPPHGIFLSVVSDLQPDGLRQALEHDGQVPAALIGAWLPAVEYPPGTERAGGPFVLLFELAAPMQRLCIARVLACPVYSRRLLVPLESACERRTLEVLLDIQRVQFLEHRRLLTIRKTLPDAPIQERGIAYQLQVLGPNGRAVCTLDVLSADATLARNQGIDVQAGNDPVYHAVAATAGPSTAGDRSFQRRVLTQLLSTRGLGRRPTHAPRIAGDLAP